MKSLDFGIELIEGGAQRPGQVVGVGEQGIPLGPKDAEVELAVEERDLETVTGGGIAMRLRDAMDEPFETEASEITGHLRGGIGPTEDGLRPKIAIAKAAGQMGKAGARPSKKAVASIKDNIRRRLRPGNQTPWEEVARDLNRTVRGWAAYFSHGSVSKARRAVHAHLDHTVRRFICRRHKVAGPGFRQFPSKRVFGELGVFSLDTAPRRGSAHAFM